jgi:AcrR family transcriptional regulator
MVRWMARTRKQPEERKAELVEVARKVFREKGYAATSVSDIVREAGVSQGTFYFYFKDKDAVFDAAAEAIVLDAFEAIGEITGQDDLSALDKLNEAMRFMVAAQALERWTDELAARTLQHMRDRVGRIAFDLYLPVVIDVIRQGKEEGTMDAPHPEATAAYFIKVTLFHLDVLKGSETMSIEEWWDAYLDFVTKVFGLNVKLSMSATPAGKQRKARKTK